MAIKPEIVENFRFSCTETVPNNTTELSTLDGAGGAVGIFRYGQYNRKTTGSKITPLPRLPKTVVKIVTIRGLNSTYLQNHCLLSEVIVCPRDGYP